MLAESAICKAFLCVVAMVKWGASAEAVTGECDGVGTGGKAYK